MVIRIDVLNNRINADITKVNNQVVVQIFGGMLRHNEMNSDVLQILICHELGHFLGGPPLKSRSGWSSTEGQADYFSTLKCMKEVLESDSGNSSSAAALDLPEEIKSMCRKQYSDDNQYNICLRSSKAAEDYGKAIADILMPGSGNTISLMTPSDEMTFVTNLRHPKVQCRVDTKFQGALCNASPLVSLDDEDETMGTCHLNNFNIIGNRPACWFVHSK